MAFAGIIAGAVLNILKVLNTFLGRGSSNDAV